MTDREQLAVVDSKLDAAMILLGDTFPGTDAFGELLGQIRELQNIRTWIGFADTADSNLPEPEVPAPTAPSVPEEDTKVVTEAKPAPAPALTKEEVRSELQSLANAHHVDIAGVMAGMGYTRLSEVPAERYAELLDAARAKVA